MAGEGCVVVAGVFPAGTVCTLVKVPDETVLRSEGGEVKGVRTADASGLVGFDGMGPGDCFFVTGYVNGEYLEVRAKGRTAQEVNEFLSQPPVQPSLVVVGTQQETLKETPPAERPELASGVPASVTVELVSGPSQESTVAHEATTQEPVPSESAAIPEVSIPSEQSPDDVAKVEEAPTSPMPSPTVREQLLAQAAELGTLNVATLSEDELRQSITDQGFTPVA